MAKKKPSLGAENDLLRIACFTIFLAMLLHDRLARTGPGHPCSNSGQSLRASLLLAWSRLHGIFGVRPVLELARDILTDLPDGPATERVLQILAAAAQDIAQSDGLLQRDFLGRIYHELLLGAEGHLYATYYTSLPAARVLAGLVFGPPHQNWDFSIEGLRKFRTIDPACGSGTLLSAAYNALRDRCEAAGAIDRAALHEMLLEGVIHGWDVLDFATQLTLSTLALHSREGHPKRANIETKPLGLTDGQVRLGSLDHLAAGAHRGTFDAVLMNPPFSRSAKTNVKFGFAKDEGLRRMNAVLREIARERRLGKASVAGLTPFFMRLGLDLAKDDGRIGMVVPRSVLSGVGSREIRKAFEAETKLGFIVSNFDPGSAGEGVDGWSWSENTDLGEVLIAAERTQSDVEDHFCTFVNVLRRPRDESEALALCENVWSTATKLKGSLTEGTYEPVTTSGKAAAFLYRIPQSCLAGNWLKACTFADPRLNRLCLEVLGHRAMRPFRDFVERVEDQPGLGRDIAAIKPKFSVAQSSSTARIVLGHQATMNTLALHPAHIKHAEPKDAAAVRLFDRFASSFLIAERPHLLTESLLAMRASERVVATAFWEVQATPDCEDWLLLWLNSTYGVMTFLAHATSSMADIFKMKKDQLANLPAPARSADASLICAKLKEQPFAPYPEEFRLAAQGQGPRFRLDGFFASALGLPELTKELYLALSCEPPVCRRSRAAQPVRSSRSAVASGRG